MHGLCLSPESSLSVSAAGAFTIAIADSTATSSVLLCYG